jgi:hypothetical protein
MGAWVVAAFVVVAVFMLVVSRMRFWNADVDENTDEIDKAHEVKKDC